MTASTESLCFVRCGMGSFHCGTNSQADSANDREIHDTTRFRSDAQRETLSERRSQETANTQQAGQKGRE